MKTIWRIVQGVAALLALLICAFFVLTVPGCLSLVSGDWLFAEPTDPGCDGDPDGPGAIVAFQVDDGTKRWSRTVGDPARMIVHKEAVIVGGHTGVVRGLSGDDGTTIWCRDLGGRGSGFFPGETLALVEETVGVIVDARTIVGLNPATGEERWKTSIDQPASAPLPVTFFASVEPSGGVFRVSDGGLAGTGVVAVDPVDGTLSTISAPGQPKSTNDTDIDVAGVRLRATSEYVENRQERQIVVTDSGSGDELWMATLPGYRSTIALSAAGVPLVMVIDQTAGTGDVARLPNTMLTAYDGRTGVEVWQRPIPIETRSVHGLGTGIVVVPSTSRLLGVDAATGEDVWSVDHGSPGKARPYKVTGNYQNVEPLGDDAAVGLIVAEKPYRD